MASVCAIPFPPIKRFWPRNRYLRRGARETTFYLRRLIRRFAKLPPALNIVLRAGVFILVCLFSFSGVRERMRGEGEDEDNLFIPLKVRGVPKDGRNLSECGIFRLTYFFFFFVRENERIRESLVVVKRLRGSRQAHSGAF